MESDSRYLQIKRTSGRRQVAMEPRSGSCNVWFRWRLKKRMNSFQTPEMSCQVSYDIAAESRSSLDANPTNPIYTYTYLYYYRCNLKTEINPERFSRICDRNVISKSEKGPSQLTCNLELHNLECRWMKDVCAALYYSPTRLPKTYRHRKRWADGMSCRIHHQIVSTCAGKVAARSAN